MPRSQAPLCLYTHCTIADRAEGTFVSLRYSLGGDRPSQTTHHALSPLTGVRIQSRQGRYFKGDSTEASAPASQSPAYPTHAVTEPNAKL